jgi:hypothetical protein
VFPSISMAWILPGGWEIPTVSSSVNNQLFGLNSSTAVMNWEVTLSHQANDYYTFLIYLMYLLFIITAVEKCRFRLWRRLRPR